MSIILRALSGEILVIGFGSIGIEVWDAYQEGQTEEQHLCYAVRFQMGEGLFERLKTASGEVVKLRDMTKAQRIVDWIWQQLSTGKSHIDLRLCATFRELADEDFVS